MPLLEHLLDQIIRSTCTELFEAYGQKVTFIGKTEKSSKDLSGMAGMVGFFGMNLRGTITLLVKEEVLKLTGPMFDKNDWVTELSNQLLGRVKRQLGRYNIDLWVGTPLSVAGKHLKVTFRTRRAIQYEFALDKASPTVKVILFVDALVKKNFTPEEPKEEEEMAVTEGEVLLFE